MRELLKSLTIVAFFSISAFATTLSGGQTDNTNDGKQVCVSNGTVAVCGSAVIKVDSSGNLLETNNIPIDKLKNSFTTTYYVSPTDATFHSFGIDNPIYYFEGFLVNYVANTNGSKTYLELYCPTNSGRYKRYKVANRVISYDGTGYFLPGEYTYSNLTPTSIYNTNLSNVVYRVRSIRKRLDGTYSFNLEKNCYAYLEMNSEQLAGELYWVFKDTKGNLHYCPSPTSGDCYGKIKLIDKDKVRFQSSLYTMSIPYTIRIVGVTGVQHLTSDARRTLNAVFPFNPPIELHTNLKFANGADYSLLENVIKKLGYQYVMGTWKSPLETNRLKVVRTAVFNVRYGVFSVVDKLYFGSQLLGVKPVSSLYSGDVTSLKSIFAKAGKIASDGYLILRETEDGDFITVVTSNGIEGSFPVTSEEKEAFISFVNAFVIPIN